VSDSGNHRRFCWQQVDVHQPLFRISHVFAPAELADRLLALYAFFSAIESVTSTVSDDAVALRKLDWWREETNRMGSQTSAHPIVAELQRSGAAECIPMSLVEDLLLNAVSRLDSPASASVDELEVLCEANGRAQVGLELAVCEAGEGIPVSMARFPFQVGRALLLRDAVYHGNFWWVPLDLLARHGLNRSQILSADHQDSAARLMADILQPDTLKPQDSGAIVEDISVIKIQAKHKYKHLYVQDALNRNFVKNLKKTSPVSYGKRLAGSSMSGAFSAWRAARRFSLSK
jgi:phytoene/squalene synthetase